MPMPHVRSCLGLLSRVQPHATYASRRASGHDVIQPEHYILDEGRWRGVSGWPIRQRQQARARIFVGDVGVWRLFASMGIEGEKGTREVSEMM